MQFLIILGAILTLLGVAGVLLCIYRVAKARREESDDAALRARLQSVVALNLGALFVSFIGLMMVVVGIMLG